MPVWRFGGQFPRMTDGSGRDPRAASSQTARIDLTRRGFWPVIQLHQWIGHLELEVGNQPMNFA